MENLGLKTPDKKVPLPHGPQSIADLISTYGDPHCDCIVGEHRTLSYSQTEAETNAAAAAFATLGLRAGDRIAATGPGDVELVIAFLASQRAGLVWVGMNQHLSPQEKAFQVETTDAKLVLADRGTADALRPLVPEDTILLTLDGTEAEDWPALVEQNAGASRPSVTIDPYAPAAIAFTSGTTGTPKGAVHSQHNMMTVSVAGHALIGSGNWTPGLRRAVPLPLTILNAMIYGIVNAMAGGGTLICFARNDIKSVAPRIVDTGAEALGLATTQMYDLVTRPELKTAPIGEVRFAWGGGNYVPGDLKSAFRELYGSELIEDFGLTEAPTSIACGRADTPVPEGAVGRAHPHLEIAALSDEAKPLPAGDVGEIGVRAVQTGPWAHVYTPTLGYWKNPQATDQILRNGWLLTGDLGKVDAEGWLSIVGRKKDLIVRGGANIYPAEVERVLKTDARLKDVVLVGLPDERLGEIAAAFIEIDPEDNKNGLRADLERLCLSELAQYKVPERWYRVEAIPRNQMRKPMKPELLKADRTEVL